MATTLQKHTITAFYKTRDYADGAATKLRALGVPSADEASQWVGAPP